MTESSARQPTVDNAVRDSTATLNGRPSENRSASLNGRPSALKPAKKAAAKKASSAVRPAPDTAVIATPPTAAKAASAKAAAPKTATPKTAAAKTAAPKAAAPKKAVPKKAPAKKAVPAPGQKASAVSPPPTERQPDVWDERVANVLGFLRRRLTGQYTVDEFGFDPEFTETFIYPMLRLLYRHYFRVEVLGVENLPAGGALVVANHSGTLPIDALMLGVAIHDETETHRNLRLLGADLVFRLPVLSEMARKTGGTLACNPDAERLLRSGEYVGVFPEGFKGIGKPYRDRYKLQRFGRGGFVSAALRTGVPIIPAAIVGAEEIYPIVGNIRPLAKVTGLPYLPLTPLFPWFGPLGMLPLPSKWLIQFGKPIDTTPYAGEAEDPIVVFNLADQVRETIQENLHSLLERRPDPFG